MIFLVKDRKVIKHVDDINDVHEFIDYNYIIYNHLRSFGYYEYKFIHIIDDSRKNGIEHFSFYDVLKEYKRKLTIEDILR